MSCISVNVSRVGGISASTSRIGGIGVIVALVCDVGTGFYLHVTPTEPQTLVWMSFGNEITYSVETNTDWNIE